MENEMKIFKDFLVSKSLKLTRPRKIILREVFQNHDHFTVDELFEQIREKHSNVSRATIYRTMPLLIDAGLLKQSLRCEAKDRYEHIYGHEKHLHFICDRCGKIIEIELKQLENILNDMAKEYDFKIREYNLGARGLCKECQKKTE